MTFYNRFPDVLVARELIENHKKDIEDQKLENEKLRCQSAVINRRTKDLDSRRLALEENLNELNEQLIALDQQQFNLNGEKKNMAEMISLLKVTDDQNSILKGIEQKSLGKLNYLRHMSSWKKKEIKCSNFWLFQLISQLHVRMYVYLALVGVKLEILSSQVCWLKDPPTRLYRVFSTSQSIF